MHASALFAVVAALATTVSGHVECNPPVAKPNGYFVTAFRVPHSYPGAKTTNVSVSIPDGVASVKPRQIGGWDVAFETKKVNGTDAISKVTWYGGSLPNELYQDFGIQMKIPDLPIGTILYFPVTQNTDPNGTIAWTSIPDASGKLADASHPAPKVTLVNSTDSDDHDHSSNSTNSTKAPNATTVAPTKSSAVAVTTSVAVALLALFI
ncbi:unnamed protein product [Aphanomyces euteiches]|uniref:YncI copper-binding domain-containing protein n=1 Tax=Aphanomyces euteiches TaxID=100861 RepID=A0A6G0WJ40_9STRA|nr:hypothetical protein Ae201684_014747 [Aphanomyces euteiches]KAH9078230.1 hypothetical protein Ae201684P_019321 [Aphanomyces euteiches]KAH9098019.1 hypothetical protein LEN26_016823 [Aphanomyces euteiches]KAH9129866.1 hypothetical protein AeMF1_000132 [Aphanomyces euteiches]KAH9157999.1 hypothetical protein AeRB84_000237 [Aphanomyces euteiches]